MYRSVASGLSTCARRVACALAAALLAIAPAAAQDRGEGVEAPPLWKIQGPKGTVFLYGSFHLLPPDVKWRTPAVDGALAAGADALRRAARESQRRFRADNVPSRPAAGGLRAHAAVARGHEPGCAFPNADGIRPAHGVDQQVVTWAKANGRTLVALEPVEAQLEVFAGLSREQEAEMLAATLKQVNQMPEMIGALLDAYRKGSVVALEKMVNVGLDDFPALRRRVLKDRHDKWLPQVEKMIADGRTHFVVVGLAHLVGHDSIVAMLRAKGVKVEGP
jgi:uncharacterized protein YbaP (TraB family)